MTQAQLALILPQVLEDRRRRQWRAIAISAGLLILVVGSLAYAGLFDLARFRHGVPVIVRIAITEGLPPDFRLSADGFRAWWSGKAGFRAAVPWGPPLFDTVLMSIGGTSLGVLLSFFLGFLAARNTTPHPAVYAAARAVLNVLRAAPELVMGIVFLVAVGVALPPILPGVLALGFHSVGMIGKFFAESIEHSDPAPIEAVRTCGGNRLQVLWHGVLPQVLPQMADVSVYRWEHNFRASLVMGMVGCGGIGLEIQAALSLMEYHQLTALVIVILVCVTLLDLLGARLRRGMQ
ncbi:MAG TPA: phosphonate ABC transporter, permease protein PhnE [Planctomycetota bacterium]|nr:phosphonate ABC transporter, permease protein PhnE [Planctomycetota bacterium]